MMKCLRCGAEIESNGCQCGFNLTVDTSAALGSTDSIKLPKQNLNL